MATKQKKGLFGSNVKKQDQPTFSPDPSVEAKKDAFVMAGKMTESLPKEKPSRMVLEMPQDLNKRLSQYCLDNDTKKAVVIRSLVSEFLGKLDH